MSEYVLENPARHNSRQPERADAQDVSIGRAAVRGAIAGFFFVVVLVGTILFAAAGVSVGVALAVGAYVGIWGGPGWGGMVAAQRRADQLADDERRAARSQWINR